MGVLRDVAWHDDAVAGPLRAACHPRKRGPEIHASTTLRRIATLDDALLDGLAALTIDCVDGGASIGFMHPLTPAQARAFWQRVAAGVAAGERALLVAEDATGVVGTVQLIIGQPDNQPHRADLAKLQVHRRARRQGLAEALMRAAERLAHDRGKTLLVLDTRERQRRRPPLLAPGLAARGRDPRLRALAAGWPLPDHVFLQEGGGRPWVASPA